MLRIIEFWGFFFCTSHYGLYSFLVHFVSSWAALHIVRLKSKVDIWRVVLSMNPVVLPWRWQELQTQFILKLWITEVWLLAKSSSCQPAMSIFKNQHRRIKSHKSTDCYKRLINLSWGILTMFTFTGVQNEALYMTYAEINTISHFIIRQIADGGGEEKEWSFCTQENTQITIFKVNFP